MEVNIFRIDNIVRDTNFVVITSDGINFDAPVDIATFGISVVSQIINIGNNALSDTLLFKFIGKNYLYLTYDADVLTFTFLKRSTLYDISFSPSAVADELKITSTDDDLHVQVISKKQIHIVGQNYTDSITPIDFPFSEFTINFKQSKDSGISFSGNGNFTFRTILLGAGVTDLKFDSPFKGASSGVGAYWKQTSYVDETSLLGYTKSGALMLYKPPVTE